MKNDREALARRRIESVLGRHGIANMRTLEQKISDAGPNGMRIDPHVLTSALKGLVTSGRVRKRQKAEIDWHYLPGTDSAVVEDRLQAQVPVYRDFVAPERSMRIGQCLEIMVYRALIEQDAVQFLGGFADLDKHDDSQKYSKVEPPDMVDGRSIHPKSLDFLLNHPLAGWAGVEVKNRRPWLYPSFEEVKDLLRKAVALDCVPVLIARRIQYSTFRLLKPCGVILHQTYNQRLPEADRELADLARQKDLLGYHDIRTGNAPDPRMSLFVGTNLPKVLPAARERFREHRDLLTAFVSGDISYKAFAAKVRRREDGTNEDHDWDDDHG